MFRVWQPEHLFSGMDATHHSRPQKNQSEESQNQQQRPLTRDQIKNQQLTMAVSKNTLLAVLLLALNNNVAAFVPVTPRVSVLSAVRTFQVLMVPFFLYRRRVQ